MKRDMEMKNFRCNGSINKIKVDFANVYKIIKIYSIINKEIKGLICNEK